MEKARLDKIIAGEGTYSRREVRLLVRQGRVLVNGVPARSPEDKVVPAEDKAVPADTDSASIPFARLRCK